MACILNFQKMLVSQIFQLFFSEYDLINKIYTRYLFFKCSLVCGLNSYEVFNK